MNKFAKCLVFALLLLTAAAAQTDPPAESNPTFTQQELDQMLAPIALYPDALLAQILMAATYPLEVVEAARWSRSNPNLKGDAAVQAVAEREWDPSVKSLVGFPQVLATLDQKLEWTERLGDAFLGQQVQVMDTVQSLRQKARLAGNLSSNAQVEIRQDGESIEIEPASPEIVYIPYYDPAVVYGTWWWSGYPPVFWPPWPGYYWNGGFAWGIGFGIGVDFFFGGWDWPHHRVHIRDHRHWFPPRTGDGRAPGYWQHDPSHRRGVPYRDGSLSRQFHRAAAAPATRWEFRGHEPQPNARPGAPVERISERAAQENPGRFEIPAREAPGAPGSAPTEARAPAFEGVGRGAEVRGFSARGNASVRNAAPRPAPARASPRR